MKNPVEKFTYLRVEPSDERLKAAEEKATALLSRAAERAPQPPELQRLADQLGPGRQQLLAQLRALREEFSHRRYRSSSRHTAAPKGTKP
jgi:hypothetical protein